VTPVAARVLAGNTRSGGVRADVEDIVASPAPAREPESREMIERAVEEANSNLSQLNEKLGFRVHEGTGQIVVQIVDRHSGEVVRESPPKEFLDLAARMKEMVGFFLDERG
jgi:flagellar protein FlaG